MRLRNGIAFSSVQKPCAGGLPDELSLLLVPFVSPGSRYLQCHMNHQIKSPVPPMVHVPLVEQGCPRTFTSYHLPQILWQMSSDPSFAPRTKHKQAQILVMPIFLWWFHSLLSNMTISIQQIFQLYWLWTPECPLFHIYLLQEMRCYTPFPEKLWDTIGLSGRTRKSS